MKAFGYLFHGAIELLPEAKHLEKVQGLLANFVSVVSDYVLDGLDLELGEILIETLDEIIESLLIKQRKGLDIKFVLEPHLDEIFKMIFRASSVFQSFKLQSKAEPENIKNSKVLITKLLEKLTEISPEQVSLEEQGLSYIDIALPKLVRESFSRKTERDLSLLSLQSPTWRLFYAITEHLNGERLQLKLPVLEQVDHEKEASRKRQ